jgi:stage II sporulation protein D
VQVGEETQRGDSFRNTYDLASSCFELQKFEQTTRVITKGVGHGLGLSQYTANEMAKEGKTYQEILQYFYEGTEMVEVAEVLWNME